MIEQQTGKLIEQRRILSEIAIDMTRRLEMDVLCQKLLERSLKVLGADFGTICLFNKNTNTLDFQTAIGKLHGMTVPFGLGLIGTAAQSRKPIRVSDVAQDPRYIEHVFETRSELDIPITIDDQLIGVLNIESKRLAAFGPDEEELGVLLASLVAVAFDNAKLFEQMSKLQNLCAIVQSQPDLAQLLSTLVSGAADLIGSPTASIGLLEKPDTLSFAHVVGEQEYSVPVSQGLTGLAIERRKPIRIGNVSEAERYYPYSTQTASEMAVPLIFRDRVLGVFNMESPSFDAFSMDDEKILETLASQASVAIGHEHMLMSCERINKQMNLLREIMGAVQGKRPVDMICQRIVAAIVEPTTALSSSILLIDESGKSVLRAFQYPPNFRHPKPRLNYDAEPIRHALDSGETVYLTYTDQKYFVEGLWSDAVRSLIIIPLKLGKRVIGVLLILGENPDGFAESELTFFSTAAIQAAMAIDNVASSKSLEET